MHAIILKPEETSRRVAAHFDVLSLSVPGQTESCLMGELNQVGAGKGVSLRYADEWPCGGFSLSEDLPLVDNEIVPPGRMVPVRSKKGGEMLYTISDVVFSR